MNNQLIFEMIQYYSGDPKRIQHLIKVYQFAKIIGEEEGLPKETQHVLETAAIVHDIGIKIAEQKYGSDAGRLQEQEGPAEAERMLKELGYPDEVIRRVSFLVGHHHTYTEVEGLDYRILLEADFLVNLYESGLDKNAVQSAYETIFCTAAGKRICRDMFGI